MNTQTVGVAPTQQEIESLKIKLEDAKRIKAFESLKNELTEITAQTINTPNEFEGAIQVPDTEKVLHTKRKIKNLTEMVISRLTKMLSPRPVIGNMIAIGLAIFALVFLQTEITLHHFDKYQHYIGIGLLIFAGLQVIKSSTRSLIIPVVATIAGAIISHTLTSGQTLFTYGADFYQYVMIAGIIGLGISVLNID